MIRHSTQIVKTAHLTVSKTSKTLNRFQATLQKFSGKNRCFYFPGILKAWNRIKKRLEHSRKIVGVFRKLSQTSNIFERYFETGLTFSNKTLSVLFSAHILYTEGKSSSFRMRFLICLTQFDFFAFENYWWPNYSKFSAEYDWRSRVQKYVTERFLMKKVGLSKKDYFLKNWENVKKIDVECI